MVVITAIKLILWGIICQAGVTSRVSTAVTTGLVLGGIFTAMDLAMFHFYLGAEYSTLGLLGIHLVSRFSRSKSRPKMKPDPFLPL